VKQAMFRGLTLIDDAGKHFDKWDLNFEIIMSKGAHLLYGETQPVKKERDDSEMFGSLHKLSSGKTKRK
jgi:hypothetical protein